MHFYNDNDPKMTSAVKVGARFGALTVTELIKGHKHTHPKAVCKCDCGETKTTRQTHLRRKMVTRCTTCSLKFGWTHRARTDAQTRSLSDRESNYKCNAKKRKLVWSLSKLITQTLMLSACHYCGKTPALGIDRYDNKVGYTEKNSVSCCSECNFAKRELTAEQFLNLIRRIYKHSCQ